MGGGLLQLVSYGKEDDILISNPDITFFKIVYHKYNNFSIESIETIHQTKFNKLLLVDIPKGGDLLTKLYIKIDLPQITAYYSDTSNNIINEFVSNIIYNYSYKLYYRNISKIYNIKNLLNNTINYFVYINDSLKLNKFYDLFESSNLMLINYSNINSILESKYINTYISNVNVLNYTFNNTQLYNESNYINLNDSTLINLNDDLNLIMSDIINLNYEYVSSIIYNLYYYKLNLDINNNKQVIYTTTDLYNDFIYRLYSITMRDNYLRQDYMLLNYSENNIDDIMINTRVKGQITIYDNKLTSMPTYLVFNDKDDTSILVLIYIIDIYKVNNSSSYYEYTGYIANINYIHNLIESSISTFNNPSIIFNILFLNTDNTYRKIDIQLDVKSIILNKDINNLSYEYIITIDLSSNTNIYNLILNCKYLKFIANNNNRIYYTNTFNNSFSNIKIKPTAVLLINSMSFNTTNNILILTCKNSLNEYNINNLNFLSAYIPILTSNNTFFDIISSSTDTDYKLQYEYTKILTNNISAISNIKDTISLYPNIVYNMLNSIFDTITLSTINTINKTTYVTDLNIQLNQTQLLNYKNILGIDSTIDNNLLLSINKLFTDYINNVINSYNYISDDINNINIYKENIFLRQIIQSFNSRSILTIVYNYDSDILPILTYNDIKLIQIDNTLMDTTSDSIIYKIRLYSNILESSLKIDTDINNSSLYQLNDIQINYVIPNNTLYTEIPIKYDNVEYIFKYTYTIIHIISSNTNYLEAYVKIHLDLYLNNIIKSTSEYSPIELMLINKFISYVPNIINTKYTLYTTTDYNIIFSLLYSDDYPNTTNTPLNNQYKFTNYYLYEPLVKSKLEDLWFIQNYYSNIYDIISLPNYYYNKIKYDYEINKNNSNDINNLYVHDIFNLILYSAYKNILYANNSTISNITSLIIQDISINISNYFKDNSLKLNKTLSTYEVQTTSLETDSTPTTTSTSTINLINVISNAFVLNTDQILNTIDNLIINYDRHFILDLTSNIIYTKDNLLRIYNKCIKTNALTYNTDLIFVNASTIYNYLKSNINQQSISTIRYENFSINSSLLTNTINNIEFDTEQKIKLIAILEYFKINYTEQFNYTNLISEINNTTPYTYSMIYSTINNAIKNYICIYLLRSSVLKNNFLSSTTDIIYIISLLTNQITDYTNINNIIDGFIYLMDYSYISFDIFIIILNNIININTYTNSQLIQLNSTPIDNVFDTYLISNSLSIYTGILLYNYITSNNNLLINYDIFSYKTILLNQFVVSTLNNYIHIITNDNKNNDLNFLSNLYTYINLQSTLTSTDIYNKINNGIKTYINLYIENTTNISSNYSRSVIINLINTYVTDFTNIDTIMNGFKLLYLKNKDGMFYLLYYQLYLIREDLINGYELSSSLTNILDSISYANGKNYLNKLEYIISNTSNNILISRATIYDYLITNNILYPFTNNYILKYAYDILSEQTLNYIEFNKLSKIININNYNLSRYTQTQLINTQQLYNTSYLFNRTSLYNILTSFKDILVYYAVDNYNNYYILTNLIYKLKTTNEDYFTTITYDDIYQIINNSIKNYINTFIKLNFTNYTQVNTIINKQISNFILDSDVELINVLNYLLYNNLITTTERLLFLNNVIYINNYTSIIQLTNNDNLDMLSYYSGIQLYNMIILSDNELIIYDSKQLLNINNKTIFLKIIDDFIIYINANINFLESYDFNTYIIDKIKNTYGLFYEQFNFSDIYRILNDASIKFVKKKLLYYNLNYNYLPVYIDPLQFINFLLANNAITNFNFIGGILPDVNGYDNNVITNYPLDTSLLSYVRIRQLLYRIYTSNLIIYEDNNFQIKTRILNIINKYKLLYPESYDYTTNIINVINSKTTLYYSDIYYIINNAIKEYVKIYLYRDTLIPITKRESFFYNYFTSIQNGSLYDDFTNINTIFTLFKFYNSVILTSNISIVNTFYYNILNVQNYASIISLKSDPIITDKLFVKNALSVYTGLKLFNEIFCIDTIKITNELLTTNLTTNLTTSTYNTNINSGLIINSVFNKQHISINNLINTNISSDVDYKLVTKSTINNIIDNLIIYDSSYTNINTKNLLIGYPYIDSIVHLVNNNKIITYKIFCDILNNYIRNVILTVLNRDSLLTDLNISKYDLCNILIKEINDYTDYLNITRALNKLESNNIISNQNNIDIHNLIYTGSITVYNDNLYLDNLTTTNFTSNLFYIYNYRKQVLDYSNLNNNFTIYTNILNSINKKYLVDILNEFKLNLINKTIETYDIDTKLINKIILASGTYYSTINYLNIISIINTGIANYIIIYLVRVLKYTSTDLIQFLGILNYTGLNVILNVKSSGLSITNKQICMKLMLKLLVASSYEEIIELPDDNTASDSYKKSDAISFYRGIRLLNEIKYRINISNNTNYILKIDRTILESNINKYIRCNDLIKTSSIINSIYNSTLYINTPTEENSTNILNIINQLNNIYEKSLINDNILTNISSELNILNTDTLFTEIINKNIKIITNQSNIITIDSIFIEDDTKYIKNNIIIDSTTYNYTYNFIINIINSNLMKNDEVAANKLITYYKTYNKLDIFSTIDKLKSIINLINNASIDIIYELIESIEIIINNSQTIIHTPTYNNEFIYDRILNYDDLTYSNKIYYLYNYFINQFYINSSIIFSPTYILTTTYTSYTIFINDTDNTYNILTNKYIGPTISNIYIRSSITDYNTDYSIEIILKNVISLLHYFSKYCATTINTTLFCASINTLIDKYYNMNFDHSIIKSYIVYIQNIYENLGSTTTFEDLNPINQIIYNNLNILSILLIHVINNYEMYNLFNNNISIINNDIYNLTTSSSASSSIFNNTYQIIYLPDISLMADSTRINLSMSSVLTYNQIITYLKGVLKYNINYLSIYSNFSSLIDDQYSHYKLLYENLYNNDTIGLDTHYYIDYYKNYLSFDFDYYIVKSKYLNLKFINNTNTYINTINLNKLQLNINNIILYLKNNITSYKSNIQYLTYIKNNLNQFTQYFDTYYSNISGLYTLFATIDIPTFIKNIFLYIQSKYISNDITAFNNILTISRQNILGVGLKRALINNNINTIIDLYNYNKIYKTTNNIELIDNYILLELSTNIKLIINNYIGEFYTTSLISILTLEEQLIRYQTTSINDKITDAYNFFINLSISERESLINLYRDDYPLICQYILSNYINNTTITTITINTRTYIYNQIIMTNSEYIQITANTYDYINGSIGKIQISNTTYKLFRKTDLPHEYMYEFSNNTISGIILRLDISKSFIQLCYQISIINDNNDNNKYIYLNFNYITNDEYNLILNNSSLLNLSITNSTLTINNFLLSESHKLVLLNISNQSYIYQISSITNYALSIYINYPYDLLYLIDTIQINSTIYNINEFIIVNIESTYYKYKSVIKLSLINNSYIKINKYYLNSSNIIIYFKQFDTTLLNLSLNYYVQNNQTSIKPQIINISGYKCEILFEKSLLNISYISLINIKFGIKNIISALASTTIIDTSYTLKDLLNMFSIDEIYNIYINKNTISNLSTIKIKSHQLYKTLDKQLDKSIFINYLIKEITQSNINILDSKTTLFNIINNTNYKYKQLISTVNINIDSINNQIENSFLSKYNDLYKDINEYINRPTIPTFSYIAYLSEYIISNIKLLVDGYIIDEINDSYMYIYHNVLNELSKKNAYNKFNSNNSNLLLETTSKNSFTMYIDVPFYFTQKTGLAFPLISNLYSKLNLELKLRDINELIIKNKYISLKYVNRLNIKIYYDQIYLNENECKLFSTLRHEYLYNKILYNSSVQLDINKITQNKIDISFGSPIKDLFYYAQLQSNIDAKQYYNFTSNYLLPRLDMSCRDKIKYIYQQIQNSTYDNAIYKLYILIEDLRLNKIKLLTKYNIVLTDYSNILFNNLTVLDISYIENLLIDYYENKLNEQLITSSTLYLNSIERYNLSSDITNKIIQYKSYTSIINGLQIYSFALYPLEYQPSGYCNFLHLRPQLSVNISNTLITKSSDIIKLNILGRSYNIIRFMSGICGIAW